MEAFSGFCAIDYESPLYYRALDLRNRVLRIPLGLSLDTYDHSHEVSQHHLAYLEKGSLFAILVLVPKRGAVVKMRQVAVEPSFQSKGIGRRLVSFSEDFAKSRGYRSMELHARNSAIPFYRKLQYEVVGDEFVEVGIPHHKMIKIL